jgi:hypothetical protein
MWLYPPLLVSAFPTPTDKLDGKDSQRNKRKKANCWRFAGHPAEAVVANPSQFGLHILNTYVDFWSSRPMERILPSTKMHSACGRVLNEAGYRSHKIARSHLGE